MSGEILNPPPVSGDNWLAYKIKPSEYFCGRYIENHQSDGFHMHSVQRTNRVEGNRGYSQYELEHIQVVDHNSHAPWNGITQLQNNDDKSSTVVNKLE